MTNKTIQLKSERDEAKRRFLVSKSRRSRERWRKVNSSLNASYKSDEATVLNKQMEDLRMADSKGEYTTIWKIIHDLSGKNKKSSVKVKKRDGTPPTSNEDLLAEWREYFSSLLNNSNGEPLSELPPPAAQDLPIETNPPTSEETLVLIRRVYHIVAYLQVGVYHIVAYHDRNFIRKWTSGICRIRKLYRI